MNQEIVRPALGQIAPVGALYDARTDTFLSQGLVKGSLSPSAVGRQNEPTRVTNYGFQDGLNDKFNKLKIPPSLGASIVSGLTAIDGFDNFINNTGADAPDFQASVYHTLTTVQDKLELSSADLKKCMSFSTLDTKDATHFLVEVQYGVQTIITLNRWLRHGEDQESVQTQFQSTAEEFARCVENEQLYAGASEENSFEQFIAYGTNLRATELVLKDLREAQEFLSLLPGQIRCSQGGCGTPIMYRLIPVKMLQYVGLAQISGDEITSSFSPENLKKSFSLFEQFRSRCKSLYSQKKLLQHHSLFVDPESLRDFERMIIDIVSTEQQMRTKLASLLKGVRQGVSGPDALENMLQDFAAETLPSNTTAALTDADLAKLTFLEQATSLGAHYFGYGGPDVSQALRHCGKQIAYVLFLNAAAMRDQETWHANRDIFLRKLEDNHGNALIAVVDCDATKQELPKARITEYENGEEAIDDLLEDQHYQSQYCFAARSSKGFLETGDIQMPLNRRFVKIACPARTCKAEGVCEWRCHDCDAPLEYGFSDQYIYCECGRALYDAFVFKCNKERHGKDFVQYEKSELLACLNSLDQSNYLNILILGETGVGKSTFINAFVNYLYFDSLDHALSRDELNFIIPCSFSTQTMDTTNPGNPIIEHKIKVGTSADEHDGSTGESATQKTQVYPLTVGSWTYRLIDTPGIGDTRGPELDKQNMADILATLSGYDYLHGIIILLKSNASRLTIHFAWCIKELLTHLHRDATRNVVFGFTNTRISNYMPGDTHGTLKKLLTDRPDIGLTLSGNSVYCFDSESFRYLAAAKNNVQMENKKEFDSSWDRSSATAHRMIEYFKTKEPHSVSSTTSLNGTRSLIKQLTEPMAYASNLIRTNIDLAADDIKQFQDASLTRDQLRTRLHPEKTLLKLVPLDKPKTVCGEKECVEYKDDGTGTDTLITDYPHPCHPVCHLKRVAPDVKGDPELLNCWAFQGNENCSQCGHSFRLHLHFYFDPEEYTTTVLDHGIEKQLKDHASDLELKQSAIDNRKRLIKEYQQEHETIQMAAAKFGVFMKENSILPYNDATVAYLDMLIEAEQAKVDVGGGQKNQDRLKIYQRDKQTHLELVKILEDSMKQKGVKRAVTQPEVVQTIKQLYSLKHFGDQIEKLQTNLTTINASSNRENPHRVKTRGPARRGGMATVRVSNNPFRMPLGTSYAAQARSQNVLAKRNSLIAPGLASGTMRTGQSVVAAKKASSGGWGLSSLWSK